MLAAEEQSARNQIELARQLGVDRTVMVYLLDELVDEGLVERRLDPADRRNRLIVATPAGSARLAAARATLDEAMAGVLAPLSESERAAFRSALHRLVEHHYRGNAEAGAACDGAEHLQQATRPRNC